jgi:hypothetical protein
MSKLLAVAATIKATLFVASMAFARGDMPLVILVSALLHLTQLGTKPGGQTLPHAPIVVSRSEERSR